VNFKLAYSIEAITMACSTPIETLGIQRERKVLTSLGPTLNMLVLFFSTQYAKFTRTFQAFPRV
jgi:hypothetical protein